MIYYMIYRLIVSFCYAFLYITIVAIVYNVYLCCYLFSPIYSPIYFHSFDCIVCRIWGGNSSRFVVFYFHACVRNRPRMVGIFPHALSSSSSSRQTCLVFCKALSAFRMNSTEFKLVEKKLAAVPSLPCPLTP